MDDAHGPSSFQDENLLGAIPDTPCLANFQLSLPGRLFADAGAQIFFQPGDGAGKGGGGLPVREIGEVIFADGFRQSFAGVRDRHFHSRKVFMSANQSGKYLKGLEISIHRVGFFPLLDSWGYYEVRQLPKTIAS